MFSTNNTVMYIRCYNTIYPWDPKTPSTNFIDGESFTLMLNSFMEISYDHFCNMMVLVDNCGVFRQTKRRVAESSSHLKHTITIKKMIKADNSLWDDNWLPLLSAFDSVSNTCLCRSLIIKHSAFPLSSTVESPFDLSLQICR